MTRFLTCWGTFFLLFALLVAPDALADPGTDAKRTNRAPGRQAKVDTMAYSGPKEDLHIYLLIGQSNMAGRAEIPEDISGVIDRCYLLNDKNEWVPAKNPMNLYSSVRKREALQKLGPGYSFAKAMLEANPDISLGLVVNARGGTKIKAWQRGTEYYTEAQKRTKAAMKQGTLKGILWHQGEGNSRSSRTYLGYLTTLIENHREDFGIENLPFVAGQIRADERSKPINAEIAKLSQAVPHTAVAGSKGLTMFDGTHFDTVSQIELGKRYAKQMLELQAKQMEKKEIEE